MSPVSRGRKNKKSKNTSGLRGAARRRTDVQTTQLQSASTALQSLLSPPRRPAWFDSANKAVLDRAGARHGGAGASGA